MEKDKIVDCYLSLGSNLGATKKNISNAIELISSEEKIIQISSFYSTPPHGFSSNNDFINACIHIQTRKSAKELLTFLQKIEVNLGRTSKSNNETYSDRIIDLDIILFGQEIIDTIELSIPHKNYRSREFVLRPLNDIASNLIDPQSKLTIQQYLINIEHSEIIINVNNSSTEPF